MSIEIEHHEINNAYLTVDFFLDGIYHGEQYPIDDLEQFCISKELLDWHLHYQRVNGEWDEKEGTHDFYSWCREYLDDSVVKMFVESKIK